MNTMTMTHKTTGLKTRLFAAAALAATLAMTGCGGGDSGGGSLPEGKIGTVGDGVNAAEYAAIQCGMNKDQVTAIIGDAPTIITQNIGWTYSYPNSFTVIIFTSPTGGVKEKSTGPAGKPSTNIVGC